MTRRGRAEIAKLLRRLVGDADAQLVADGDVFTFAASAAGRRMQVPAALARMLIANGLLYETAPRRYAASQAASAWLARESSPDAPFRAQHDPLEVAPSGMPDGALVLKNLRESPVAALARSSARTGEAWLAAHEVAAAERLRRDFEVGQLQPRITANWSASINTGRRSGSDVGSADLTDSAIAARQRFNHAMRTVGPELSDVLVDVCCFLKGLELVERERQWPARSAKLVLRLALQRLAGHYGLTARATGKASCTRHWGASDYRPAIS